MADPGRRAGGVLYAEGSLVRLRKLPRIPVAGSLRKSLSGG